MATLFTTEHLWLLDLLYHNPAGLTLEDINLEWQKASVNSAHTPEIPRQTFNRWRKTLQESFGISIPCVRQKVEEDGRFNLYKINNIRDITGNQLTQWLVSMLSVSNFLRKIKNRSALENRIDFDQAPRIAPSFEQILTAMETNVKLHIIYKKFKDKAAEEFDLCPYGIKRFRKRWYVVGVPTTHPDELRTYGIERIVDAVITREHFDMPADFNIHNLYKGSFGIYLNQETVVPTDSDVTDISIVVLADQTTTPYWRTLPLHVSQTEIGKSEWIDKSPATLFSFQLNDPLDKDFIRELRLWGAGIKVISPASLRDKIVESARDILRVYETK